MFEPGCSSHPVLCPPSPGLVKDWEQRAIRADTSNGIGVLEDA